MNTGWRTFPSISAWVDICVRVDGHSLLYFIGYGDPRTTKPKLGDHVSHMEVLAFEYACNVGPGQLLSSSLYLSLGYDLLLRCLTLMLSVCQRDYQFICRW
jgi:hypothetical protein